MELIELAREVYDTPMYDQTTPTWTLNPAWAQSKGKFHFYYSIRTGSQTGSDDAEADNYQPLVYFEMAVGSRGLKVKVYPVSC